MTDTVNSPGSVAREPFTVAIVSAVLLSACAGYGAGHATPVGSQWMPLQAAHMPDTGLVPARADTVASPEARFIVKIKDAEVEALTRLFFRNETAARTSFSQWAADKPLFSDFDLVSCSYSGEVILRQRLAARSGADLQAQRATLLQALRNHPQVAYADPDFIAQTQVSGGRQ
ncbi:MAG: hypothetical protein AAFR41_06890 [Pseudomonadota bacterium]